MHGVCQPAALLSGVRSHSLNACVRKRCRQECHYGGTCISVQGRCLSAPLARKNGHAAVRANVNVNVNVDAVWSLAVSNQGHSDSM